MVPKQRGHATLQLAGHSLMVSAREKSHLWAAFLARKERHKSILPCLEGKIHTVPFWGFLFSTISHIVTGKPEDTAAG